MGSDIKVAVIFALSTIAGPIALAAYLGWQRRKEARIVIGKLDVIHTLVDGTMTAAMQDSLASSRRELVSLGEIIELNRAAGREPSVEALAEIDSTRKRIDELTMALEERHRQFRVVEAQQILAADEITRLKEKR